MKNAVRVEIAQVRHRRFDVDHNLVRLKDAVGLSEADIVVFPEMFLTGYSLGRDAFNLALDDVEGALGGLSDLSNSLSRGIVFGAPIKDRMIKGKVMNAAVVVLPGNAPMVYHKMHLVDFDPFEESAFFSPGRDPMMFEFRGLRFGVMVCYDLFFPELAKYYALAGADALICISASPSTTRPFFEAIMTARAIEDTTYVIYSNLVGMDGRMDFWGGGAIIDPRGKVLAKGPYFEEASIQADLELPVIESARRHRPTLRDTRPEVLERMLRVLKGFHGEDVKS